MRLPKVFESALRKARTSDSITAFLSPGLADCPCRLAVGDGVGLLLLADMARARGICRCAPSTSAPLGGSFRGVTDRDKLRKLCLAFFTAIKVLTLDVIAFLGPIGLCAGDALLLRGMTRFSTTVSSCASLLAERVPADPPSGGVFALQGFTNACCPTVSFNV